MGELRKPYKGFAHGDSRVVMNCKQPSKEVAHESGALASLFSLEVHSMHQKVRSKVRNSRYFSLNLIKHFCMTPYYGDFSKMNCHK